MRNWRALVAMGAMSCAPQPEPSTATAPPRPPPNCPLERSPSEIDCKKEPSRCPLSRVDDVVGSLRPDFKACYQSGLRLDPALDGCVVLRSEPRGETSAGDVNVVSEIR